MVIMVRPDTLNPAPPVDATSPDGHLYARADPALTGVRLQATFPGTPEKVRFLRDGAPVMGGDPAWCVAGKAYVIDLHAPVGVSAWTAVALSRTGAVLDQSEAVNLVTPEPGSLAIKSLDQPGLSMQVQLHLPAHETTLMTRNVLSDVPGSEWQAGTWDVPVAGPRTYRWLTQTVAEMQQCLALLKAGPMMLQPRPIYGDPELWAITSAVTVAYVGSPDVDPRRWFNVEFIPVVPPPTVDSVAKAPRLLHRDLIGSTLREVSDRFPGFRSG